MSEKKEIVEINGVKFEVDLSMAKIVSEYKVGDKINVLIKEYSEHKVYPGIIVGFDNFKDLPTISICYLKVEYSNAVLVFTFFNNESKEVDIAPCRASDILFNKEDALTKMDAEVTKKEEEIKDIKRKKQFFLDNFQRHFEGTNIESV